MGGTLNVTDATSLGGTLDVTNATTLNNDLTVSTGGATSLGGTLNVDGATSLGGTLDITGDTSLQNNLNITGYTTINSNLEVDYTTKFNSNIILSADNYISDGVTGEIRYNTVTSQFEGYSSGAWGSLGGVKDISGNTFIRAETYPGAGNNELEFFTGDGTTSNLIMKIDNSIVHIHKQLRTDDTIYSHNDIIARGNVIAHFSDIRLKTNIEIIDNPLEIINKLNGFYYVSNDIAKKYGYDNSKQIGISAQDAEKVLPEIVSLAPFDIKYDADGNRVSISGENYLTISYEKLVPVFVEGIKKLDKQNTELKEELKTLKENYHYLLEEINKIKQKIN